MNAMSTMAHSIYTFVSVASVNQEGGALWLLTGLGPPENTMSDLFIGF